MLYITKIAIALNGDRIERGSEVELSPEDFLSLDANDFTLVGEVVEEEEEEEEVAVEDMSLSQLRDKASKLGLSTSGTKADLLDRISLKAEEEEVAE